jgi:hypothetical protein
MNLADLRLQIHPGDGLVACLETAVVVLPEASSRPTFAEELLAVVTSGCDAYGPTPGRQLVRKLAGLVTGTEPDQVGSFAVVAAADDGLALMLCGSMDLQLIGAGTDHEVLSGRDVATWVDRVIRNPFDRLVLVASGVAEPALDPRTDLRAGLVSGSGVTLSPRGTASSSRPSRAEPRGVPQPRPPVGPAEPEPAAVRQDERLVVTTPPTPARAGAAPEPNLADSGFVSIPLEPLPAGDLHPLPVASGAVAAPAPGVTPDSGEAVVQGIGCARGHFNNPEARFCGACGIAMVQQTHNLIPGLRPSLGVLVLDNGASFVVDHDYVIGREPASSELVRTGEALPLVIDDPELALSRVHARILLRDWEVLIEDARSANGTRILRPGSSEWTPLAPEEPTAIISGTRIGMGDRELIFDSHHRPG